MFQSNQNNMACTNFTIIVDPFTEEPERFMVSFNIRSDPDVAISGGIINSEVTILDRKFAEWKIPKYLQN